MAKSNETKAVVHSTTTTLDQALRAIDARAAAATIPPADVFDPEEMVVQGLAMIGQLAQAKNAKEREPDSFFHYLDSGLTWTEVFQALIANANTAIHAQGGRTMPVKAPEQSPIDLAVANAERAHRRLRVATEPSQWEAEKNAAMEAKIFGARKAPTGKVRWEAELTSNIQAIEEMGEAATPVLKAMLPMLRGALAQLQAAQPLPAGRTTPAPVYSEPAIRAALALGLAVGDFRGWAASQASDTRYGAILRAIAPKRGTDTKAEAGTKEGGSKDGAGSGAQSAGEGSATPAGDKASITANADAAKASSAPAPVETKTQSAPAP